MSYRIEWNSRALRQLRRLDRHAQRAITLTVQSLAADPRPRGAQKLKGELAGKLRIRVGIHYRVVYSVDDNAHQIDIARIGSREDVY